MKALVNCVIYTGRTILRDHAVLIDGERIIGAPALGDVPDDCERIDLNGRSVAPGFVDLQAYGGRGVLFNNQPNVAGLQTICDTHLAFGVTKMLPTLMTDSADRMRQARAVANAAVAAGNRSVLGMHFEGPFLSLPKAGVHPKTLIRPLSDADARIILDADNLPILLTIAPESFPPEHVERFLNAGIRLSIGHTNASARVVNEYFDRGVRCVTHIHNAMSPFGSREPGVVGAVMADDRVFAGIIVDGLHVDFQSVRATWNAFRARHDAHLFLVTDAMPAVGGDVDHFMLGELRINVVNGQCRTADGTLGGSSLDMATAIRNCIEKVGIPKDETLRMASTYPAQFMGLDGDLGFIEAGKIADIAIFDDRIHVSGVVRNGRVILNQTAL